MRLRLAVFISIIQSILFLGHLLVYFTWSAFWGAGVSGWAVKTGLALCSMSFVAASLRSWYAHDFLSRTIYKISALWLGLASNLLWASILCWVVGGIAWLARLAWPRPAIADVVFGAAALAFVAGLINGAWLRVTRVKITLPNLPQEWRGRTAVLASDLHLGPVRNGRFVQRVVNKIAALQPNIVFLAGDVYDGTAANFEKLAEPWAEFVAARKLQNNEQRASSTAARLPSALQRHAVTAGRATAVMDAPPEDETAGTGKKFLGVFAIPGNHEEFYRHAEYLAPLVQAGVRCLDNEKLEVDGLQVLGVNYRDASDPERYRMVLRGLGLDPGAPACCFCMRRYNCQSARLPASRSTWPGTRTAASSFRGPGSQIAYGANLCTACSGWATCRCLLHTAPGPGDRHCGWEPGRRSS